jgi:hypothetical protein
MSAAELLDFFDRLVSLTFAGSGVASTSSETSVGNICSVNGVSVNDVSISNGESAKSTCSPQFAPIKCSLLSVVVSLMVAVSSMRRIARLFFF